MNTNKNTMVKINDFLVRQRNTVSYKNEFMATNEDVIICFYSESLKGRNYSKIKWLFNKKTEKFYHAQRFHQKYIFPISQISGEIFVNYFKQGKTSLL